MDQEKCWKAVQTRDKREDGKFFYGVMTTGVFCRPSCPSPNPLRKNVRFYATPTEAQMHGLRACRRCHPLTGIGQDLYAERIHKLCRYIESHIGEKLTLGALAKRVHLSQFHFQRKFKTIVGLTPKEYVDASRLKQFKSQLRGGESITDAIYEAGFGSSSRLYERVNTRLGMTPRDYRNGGLGVEISYADTDTPLGRMMMGATDRGLCFVQFGESSEALLRQLWKEYPGARISAMQAASRKPFDAWMRALTEHLAGLRRRLELPLDVCGTAFQMKVWSYLQQIPYGEVRSYTEVAEAIGKPKAVRAVASACARNRLAIVIPCHRVIRGNGEPGGYRWGLDRKRTLIDTERSHHAGAL